MRWSSFATTGFERVGAQLKRARAFEIDEPRALLVHYTPNYSSADVSRATPSRNFAFAGSRSQSSRVSSRLIAR